ncbi:MAG TPA: RNA-binding protein, partial [Alphaproteobacteria bacterium]|nr:RNA-binding protein [Alphaproteobacteria bacterium]
TLRRCIVTRQALEKPAMIRFVLDPEGRVVPDLKEKLPGRGLWVTADRAILAEAAKKNAFAKAARQSAKVPADLVERVVELARREVAELIGLARKSGQLRAGFEKVQIALQAGKARVLIAASDGAEDGRGKLARLAHSGVEICAPLTAAELAQALGREHAVHAAIAESGIAERIIVACRRLRSLQAAETTTELNRLTK